MGRLLCRLLFRSGRSFFEVRGLVMFNVLFCSCFSISTEGISGSVHDAVESGLDASAKVAGLKPRSDFVRMCLEALSGSHFSSPRPVSIRTFQSSMSKE